MRAHSFTIEMSSNESAELFPEFILTTFIIYFPKHVLLDGQWKEEMSKVWCESNYQNVAERKIFFFKMRNHEKHKISTNVEKGYYYIFNGSNELPHSIEKQSQRVLQHTENDPRRTKDWPFSEKRRFFLSTFERLFKIHIWRWCSIEILLRGRTSHKKFVCIRYCLNSVPRKTHPSCWVQYGFRC